MSSFSLVQISGIRRLKCWSGPRRSDDDDDEDDGFMVSIWPLMFPMSTCTMFICVLNPAQSPSCPAENGRLKQHDYRLNEFVIWSSIAMAESQLPTSLRYRFWLD
eukprot:TRINITY_DN6034_c1_g1_i1.p1 TRINITY_DN6034_c1_g1~~TRINITY_DN6034_c1_g1_i1.p1  ORF type:complete len:105 (-),score=7.09 TRINITY_DN6034_c1_g1_i1:8-322(-)